MLEGLAPVFLFAIVLFSAGSGYIFFVYSRAHQREAKLHLSHMQEMWREETQHAEENGTEPRNSLNLRGTYAEAGLFDEQEISNFKRKQRGAIVWGTVGIFFAVTMISGGAIVSMLVSLVLGLALSYLYSERMLRVQQADFSKKLVFFLPVVMERLVMAVQAGLDIIPAIQAIVRLEQQSSRERVSGSSSFDSRDNSRPVLLADEQDPVTKLLGIVSRLCDSGLPFEQALRHVTTHISSTAIKHSFIHLAVAHKEGGELIGPLRELSDATQLYFQETVEEEIAVMPVKATMPLLLTFAGLLILFITSPVLQISKFAKAGNPQQTSSQK